MLKILYAGKHYLDVIDTIPRGEEFVILDHQEYLKTGEKDFIKYVDHSEDLYIDNPDGIRLMIKKGIEYDKSILRDYLVITDFYQMLPPFRKIGLYGSKEKVIRFIKFLTSYYHCGFRIRSGNWQTQYLIEESVIKNISSFPSQIDLQKDSVMDIVLDSGSTDINIFLWDGKVEDIYEWKNSNSSDNSFVLTSRIFSMRKIKKKWKVRTYYINKYNIKKVWESELHLVK